MSGRSRRPAAFSSSGRALTRVVAVGAAVVLTIGCVVVPTTRDVYDPDCRLMRREVTLEAGVVGRIRGCVGYECGAMLATLGVVAAASAVVSGSIAIVGNAVYWLEHAANCRRVRESAAAASSPAGAASAP